MSLSGLTDGSAANYRRESIVGWKPLPCKAGFSPFRDHPKTPKQGRQLQRQQAGEKGKGVKSLSRDCGEQAHTQKGRERQDPEMG